MMGNMNHWDVIIIGAGAAGLMCAATAGRRGRRVLVLDHAHKPGKKLLISGGGRCNFTNYYIEPSAFLSQNPHFCKSALARYNQWHFIELMDRYGIGYHEREHGQLFCNEKARDILDMLLAECRNADVRLQYGIEIDEVVKAEDGFDIRASGQHYYCSSLVIATGGLSIPKMGATPFGLKIAEQFGIRVVPTRAGLVPFTLKEDDRKRYQELSGVSVDVLVTAQSGMSFREFMLFTHRGLSGPAILQISSYWHPGESVVVNLLPEIQLESMLAESRENKPGQSLKNTLAQWLPRRLVETRLEDAGIIDRPLKQLQTHDFKTIEEAFQRWEIRPNGTEGYRTAEVTLGGVDTHELSSKTMQASKVPGLFFIGEVVDVTGHLGGFNLQWAWSSGYAAGEVV
jgi:predicted Rossmann fold flavoprotein